MQAERAQKQRERCEQEAAYRGPAGAQPAVEPPAERALRELVRKFGEQKFGLLPEQLGQRGDLLRCAELFSFDQAGRGDQIAGESVGIRLLALQGAAVAEQPVARVLEIDMSDLVCEDKQPPRVGEFV